MTDDTLVPFFDQLSSAPADPAFRYRTRYRAFDWTRGRASSAVRQMAAWYRCQGVRPGDVVLIWGPNSPPWAIAFLGCLFAGVVAVPLDERSRAEFIRSVATETRPRILLRSRRQPDPDIGVQSFILEDVEWLIQGQSPGEFPSPALQPEQIAEILYTSGTTGQPKGVILTQRNLASVLGSIRPIVPPGVKFHLLSVLPLSHIFEQTIGLLLPLDLGMSIVYLDAVTPINIGKALRRDQISLVVAVPRLLELLRGTVGRNAGGAPLGRPSLDTLLRVGDYLPVGVTRALAWPVRRSLGPALRYFVVGGAPLAPEIEQFFDALGIPVLQGYGLTETTGAVTANTFDERRVGTVGRPLRGQNVTLGPSDEIWVQGPNVTPGYFGNPVLTQQVFAGGWLKTGDVGDFDEDGFLTIRGRLKDVIVTSAGVNVYPEDVEAQLNREAGVRDSAVLEWRGRITAVLLLEDAAKPRARAIVEAANASLVDAQQIQQLVVWPFADFPRSTTLKVKKHEVRAQLDEIATHPEAGPTPPAVPSTRIGRLAAQVGHVPPTRATPSAQLGLDLGLDSIDRLELAALIEQELGIEIDESSTTATTTVGDLERLVATGTGEKPPRPASQLVMTPVAVAIRHLLREGVVLPLFRLVACLRVEGREHLAEIQGPAIFVANHTSYLDPLAILAALPARWRDRLAPAAWAEYFEPTGPWWLRLVRDALFGLVVLAFGAFKLPQQRGFRRSLEQAGELVDHGYSILIFPEGQRTLTGRMGHFREGIGVAVQALRVPVVPLWLGGLDAIMPPPGTAIRQRGTAVVRFGRPRVFRDESYVEIARELEAAVRHLGESARPALRGRAA